MSFFGLPIVASIAITYPMVALVAWFLRKHEGEQSPEKAARYVLLPWRYKACCWLWVIPLFATAPIAPIALVPAFVSLSLLEAACIRWYRQAGLL